MLDKNQYNSPPLLSGVIAGVAGNAQGLVSAELAEKATWPHCWTDSLTLHKTSSCPPALKLHPNIMLKVTDKSCGPCRGCIAYELRAQPEFCVFIEIILFFLEETFRPS